MAATKQLKYVDHKKIWFPSLFFYRGGLALPSGDNIIKVTEHEAENLLKRKNGNKSCFEEIKGTRANTVIETPEIKEDNE